MSVIRATVRNGKIIADAPADWPEGARVTVALPDGLFGLTEEEQSDDPEAIARWVKWAENLRPFLSEQQEAEWQAERRRLKEWNLATFYDRADKLRKMWNDE